MRFTTRLAAALTALAASIGFGSAAGAQTKAFSIPQLDTVATVRADGSMDVVEKVVYRFEGGPFSNGFRTFTGEWIDNIENFEARDSQQVLQVLAPGQADRKQAFQWKYSQPGSGTRTFTLSYRVREAVSIGPDVAELYWQFVGKDHDGLGRVTVRVDLPGRFGVASADEPATSTDVVRAWGHGPLDGDVRPFTDRVELDSPSLSPRTFFEARIVIPRSGFTAAPQGTDRLAKILAEERSFQATGLKPGDENKGKLARSIAPVVAPILGFGSILTCLRAWRRHGKEYESSIPIGDYWREPMDEPPAIVAATKAWGGVDGKALASSLVDLAQRGYLTIVEHRIDRFGPDKTEYIFTATQPKARVGRALPEPLEPWEADLLSRVFRGQATTTSTAFIDDAKADRATSRAWWVGWSAAVKEAMNARNLIETGKAGPAMVGATAILASVVGGIVLIAASKNARNEVSAWGFIALAGAVASVVILAFIRRRAQSGADLVAKANGLKKFLKDFSSLNEAPVASLAIWQRYLVDAVALGVAADLMKGLTMKLPQIAQDPGFAPWFIPLPGSDLGSSMSRFPTDMGTTAQSAMAPQSQSGSGGGFSGGGGGGGGGGGFGAS